MKQHPGIVVRLWLIGRIVWKPSGVDVSLFQKCVDCIKAPRAVRLLAGARQRQVNTRKAPLGCPCITLHHVLPLRQPQELSTGRFYTHFASLFHQGAAFLSTTLPFLFTFSSVQLLNCSQLLLFPAKSAILPPSSLLIRYLSFTQYTFTASRVASCRSVRNISSS